MTTMAYITRWNGIVMATAVAIPERAQDVADSIKEWLGQGATVDLVPLEWVRQNFGTGNPLPGGEE